MLSLQEFMQGADNFVTWIDYVALSLLIIGSLLSIISGIGILRMPDFYSRIHAAGISDTLATGLIFVGLFFETYEIIVAVKLFMVLFFLFLTSPASAQALAKAAYLDNISPDAWREKQKEKGC